MYLILTITLSFTHINDIVDNLIKLINKFKNHKSSLNRVISIGNPKTVKLMKLIQHIEKNIGKKLKIFTSSKRRC